MKHEMPCHHVQLFCCNPGPCKRNLCILLILSCVSATLELTQHGPHPRSTLRPRRLCLRLAVIHGLLHLCAVRHKLGDTPHATAFSGGVHTAVQSHEADTGGAARNATLVHGQASTPRDALVDRVPLAGRLESLCRESTNLPADGASGMCR